MSTAVVEARLAQVIRRRTQCVKSPIQVLELFLGDFDAEGTDRGGRENDAKSTLGRIPVPRKKQSNIPPMQSRFPRPGRSSLFSPAAS